MSNREIANDIVGEICNHMCVVPSEEKWKRLVDYVEHKLEAAQQPRAPDVCPVCKGSKLDPIPFTNGDPCPSC